MAPEPIQASVTGTQSGLPERRPMTIDRPAAAAIATAAFTPYPR